LRQRIVASTVILVLGTCAVVAGLSLYIAELEIEKTTGDQQVALLSAAAAYLDNDIADKQVLLKTIAEGINGSLPGACSRVQASLEQYTMAREEFANVVAFDHDGVLIADLHDRQFIGSQHFNDRTYFKKTMRDREGVISEPFVSKLSKKPVVLITEPILDSQGHIICILAGSINLDQPKFFGQITQLHPGTTGYLFAMTRDGMLLHHPDTHRLLNNVRTEPGGAIPSTLAALHGWEGWVIGKAKNGRPALITYHRMRNPDWILGSVYPVDEAFSSVATARKTALIGAAVVAVLVVFLGWYVTRVLLKPLHQLEENARAVEKGEQRIEAFDLQRPDEIGALGRAFYSLFLKRQAAEEQLSHLARTDLLTGLGNRRRLNEEFTEIAARAHRHHSLIALGFLDIDHFKSINDTYGHEAGDVVLQKFSSLLKGAVRTTDHVYRLAGDEFIIVFENFEQESSADIVATKILDSFRSPIPVHDKPIHVTTSMGIVQSGWEHADLDDMLRRADAALYATKNRGRNGYTFTCL
jgi:diguanylate cyclase (GGDEF)-like protein